MEHLFNLFIKKTIRYLQSKELCAEIEYYQMYYGLQILLYNLLITTCILLLAFAINCFISSTIILIVFGTFRIIAGGYHFNSMPKCILVTTSIIVGCGKCAKLFNPNLLYSLIICTILMTFFWKYTPEGSKKNPFNKKFQRSQQKRFRIALIIFSLLSCISSYLRSYILLAMTFTAILLLPDMVRRALSKDQMLK